MAQQAQGNLLGEANSAVRSHESYGHKCDRTFKEGIFKETTQIMLFFNESLWYDKTEYRAYRYTEAASATN